MPPCNKSVDLLVDCSYCMAATQGTWKYCAQRRFAKLSEQEQNNFGLKKRTEADPRGR